jgi:hypothetical protein
MLPATESVSISAEDASEQEERAGRAGRNNEIGKIKEITPQIAWRQKKAELHVLPAPMLFIL